MIIERWHEATAIDVFETSFEVMVTSRLGPYLLAMLSRVGRFRRPWAIAHERRLRRVAGAGQPEATRPAFAITDIVVYAVSRSKIWGHVVSCDGCRGLLTPVGHTARRVKP